MRLSKFLLVEDDDEVAKIIIGMLDYHGHNVVRSPNGRDGLRAATTDKFDAILLDYMLPDMDGLQVCQQIRAAGKECPIILTSTALNMTSPDDLLAAGITAFVPRPLSQNLMAVLDKHVTTRSVEQKEKQQRDKFFTRLRRWLNSVFASDYAPFD